MPEISRFYGIVIKMFFKPKEPEPSHVHAVYGENNGIFDVSTGDMIEGDMPAKAKELIKEWIQNNKGELQEMWDKQKIVSLPPLK